MSGFEYRNCPNYPEQIVQFYVGCNGHIVIACKENETKSSYTYINPKDIPEFKQKMIKFLERFESKKDVSNFYDIK